MGTLKIDHARINAAIARAEETTSGEITCVIKAKSLDYAETPLAWGFGIALVTPFILALFGINIEDTISAHLPSAIAGWEASHAGLADYNHLQALAIYSLIQVAIFLIVYAIIRFSPLKLLLTPKATKHRRAHEKAKEQFYARGLHLTTGQTGVMIFCALEEHFVEVIADQGIYSKVDPSVWNETIDVLLKHIQSGDLTTAFEAAVEKCGAALSAHFPPDENNPNELPDVLIEI
ncbi:hypothetical protein [Asticcacaulis sp. 201]|uniref:TPM domain-containing protein n=1 Tax=Asticcacaulis sp. 201 TaxID=3028787 RepID=UPI002916266D|nr:hypothetical protein [Asticcacaulis sp. 201]MDV6332614.1 hypothetical protein [Asticcacaulis sp. 201]